METLCSSAAAGSLLPHLCLPKETESGRALSYSEEGYGKGKPGHPSTLV